MKRTPLRRKTPLARSFKRRPARPARVPIGATELVVDGPAAKAGVIGVYVAGQRIHLGVRKGDSANAISSAIDIAITHHESTRTTYRERVRAVPYMLWVKRQRCLMRGVWGTCSGPVEADHAGQRGMSRKAHDSTCIPLCHQHHMAGRFPLLGWPQERRRAWLHAAIVYTQALARSLGVEVPIDPAPVAEYPVTALDLAWLALATIR